MSATPAPLSPSLSWRILAVVGAAAAVSIGAILAWSWWHERTALETEQTRRATRAVTLAHVLLQERIARGRRVLQTLAESAEVQDDVARTNRLGLAAALRSLQGDEAAYLLAIYDRRGVIAAANLPFADTVFQGLFEHPEQIVDRAVLEVLVGDLTVSTALPIERDGDVLGWVVGAFRLGRLFARELSDTLDARVAFYADGLPVAQHHAFPADPPPLARLAPEPTGTPGVSAARVMIGGETFDVALRRIEQVEGPETYVAAGVSRAEVEARWNRYLRVSTTIGALGVVGIVGLVAAFLMRVRRQQHRLVLERDALYRRSEGLVDRVAHLQAVVHDIKAPVAGIQLRCEDLLEDATDEDLRRALEQIADTCERLNLFLINVLTAAEAEEGTIAPRDEVVLIPGLIEDVVERLAPLARRRQVTLAARVDDAFPAILADPALLERALVNLVANAIAATPPGGTVAITAAAGGDRLTLAVEDDGPGFTAFDPSEAFARDRPRVKDQSIKAGSSGLGLYIVERIARLLGGSARAENLPRGGARVSIELPFRPARRTA